MIFLADQNRELRIHLDIKNASVSAHCDQVVALKKHFNHTIRCIGRPHNGNCVTYALQLLEQNERLCYALQKYQVRPGSEFVKWLLLQGRLQEVDCEIDGALALYFRHNCWRHVGLVSRRGRLVSKWGSYGVFDHQYYEVCSEYGDTLRFFAPINSAKAVEYFFEFGCGPLNLPAKEVESLAALLKSDREDDP
jgi:hypothetical protein